MTPPSDIPTDQAHIDPDDEAVLTELGWTPEVFNLDWEEETE